MMKLMIGNQKGGVGKTTTALALGRCFADRGLRTLLVDSDPQGSIAVTLKLKPEFYLADFILNQVALPLCVHTAAPNFEILAGNRDTVTMEQRINTMYGREHVFQKAFGQYEGNYDVILVDVSPSISLLQACSMVFCQSILIPVSMDTLSISGAGATIFSAKNIGDNVMTSILPIAILPTIVNQRYGLTEVVMGMIGRLSETYNLPVLNQIRTDQTIGRAARTHSMLKDVDPGSKALEDYETAATSILKLMDHNGEFERFTRPNEALNGVETAQVN